MCDSDAPDILKQFNPLLYGYSLGNGGAKSSNAVFNVAVSGATAPDLPGQARELVSLLANSPQVNFSADWKVITIWIGGNDLCAVCNEPEKYSAGSYQDHLLTTLTILQEIPRVYVNLVQILDVSRLHELQEGLCDSFHKCVFRCHCLVLPCIGHLLNRAHNSQATCRDPQDGVPLRSK